MDNNKRPETMERITTAALANDFIAEQIEQIRAQVGDKKFCSRSQAEWIPLLQRRC